MKRLYIARHGETNYNRENRYAGTIDIELNDNGKKQSELLSEKLSALPIDVIVSSPKKRALQTAQIINNTLNRPLYINDCLIERDLGIFQGYTRDEVAEKYPDLWKRNILHDKNNREHGGETVEDVLNRAQKAINEILKEYKDKNILIVTHGYISRMMNSILRKVPEDEINKFLLSNCQYEEYKI